MIIGFTGTRSGMTNRQKGFVRTLLLKYKPLVVHHGMCIGADFEFHEICRNLKKVELPRLKIVGHPSNLPHLTMPDLGMGFEHIYSPRPPLERNHEIVEESNKIIAAPYEMKEIMRSGTWSTIRYTRKKVKHLMLIWPQEPQKS